MGLVLDVLAEQAVLLIRGQWGVSFDMQLEPGKTLVLKYWRSTVALKIELVNGVGTPAGTATIDDDLAPSLLATHQPTLIDPRTAKPFSVQLCPHDASLGALVHRVLLLQSYTRLKGMVDQLRGSKRFQEQGNLSIQFPSVFDESHPTTLVLVFSALTINDTNSALSVMITLDRQTGLFLASCDNFVDSKYPCSLL